MIVGWQEKSPDMARLMREELPRAVEWWKETSDVSKIMPPLYGQPPQSKYLAQTGCLVTSF